MAVRAAVEYGLAAFELGDERTPPPPPALLVQARLAVRNGVSVETVLRRYLAGQAVIADFLIEEAEGAGPLMARELGRLLREQIAVFDRLIERVAEEYGSERAREQIDRTAERRCTAQVERLLAGERLHAVDLPYELDAHHLAVIARGRGALDALRHLAADLECRLLCLERGEEVSWAWLGSRSRVEPEDFRRLATASRTHGLRLALGEPADGLHGWRLSHRQAKAAFPIALRRGDRLVRYADVAMLATIVQDELLADFLGEVYLKPLERQRDGGEALRKTLRAYFAAGRNISSAAHALGVKSHTVTNRLRSVEEATGQPLDRRGAEFEVAMRLAELSLDERRRS